MKGGAILNSRDERWLAFRAHADCDVYHLPAYAELSGPVENGRAAALYAETNGTEILLPVLLRDIPGQPGLTDAVSPYGYSGPLVKGPANISSQLEAWEMVRQAAQDAGIVSAFIRLHPLQATWLQAPSHLPWLREVQHGPTVWMDLLPPVQEIETRMRSNLRKDIRRLVKDAYVVRMDDWSVLPSFIEVYNRTLDRRQATDYYYFQPSYYDRLRTALAGRMHIFSVHSKDGRLAAAAIIMEAGWIAQYHLAATDPAFLEASPGKLALDAAWRWAKSKGIEAFHLGGGVGGTPGPLFQFKAGFSPLTTVFRTWSMVFDQGVFNRLCPSHETRFFPPYRAPQPRQARSPI